MPRYTQNSKYKPKRKRRVRRVRRYKKKPKAKRRRPTMISLPRQIIPRRAFSTIKTVRWIRIPSRFTVGPPVTLLPGNWNMPEYGTQSTPDIYPVPQNTLYISCNDFLAPFNEEGSPNAVDPDYPGPPMLAFLNSFDVAGTPTTTSQALFDSSPRRGGTIPPTGADTGYRNLLGSFYDKLVNFYDKWTVVGSKCKISMIPDGLVGATLAREPNRSAMFTLGKKSNRILLDRSAQPQSLQEQPQFTSREYHGVRQTNGKAYAFTMTKNWSARKDMGLSRGNIVNNQAITGNRRAQYSPTLCGLPNQFPYNFTDAGAGRPRITSEFANHPLSQDYFVFTGNSLLTNNTTPGAYVPSKWPPGLIKVEMHYSTVWTEPRFSNNEIGG